MAKYCPYCTSRIDSGSVCTKCRYASSYTGKAHHLKPGTLLNRKYLVGIVMKEDAVGITYIGRNLLEDSMVLLTEFFPAGEVKRNNSISNDVQPLNPGQYNKERYQFAQSMKQISSEIIDQCNNTTYAVTDSTEAQSNFSFETERSYSENIPSSSSHPAASAKKKSMTAVYVTILVSVLLIAALLLTFFVFIPQHKLRTSYEEAVKLMEDGEYSKAVKAFEEIADYKDSAEKILEIKYKQAKEFLEDKNYSKAIDLFEELGTYEDSADLIKKAKYSYAGELYKDKKYERAENLYSELDEYRNSKENAALAGRMADVFDAVAGSWSLDRVYFSELFTSFSAEEMDMERGLQFNKDYTVISFIDYDGEPETYNGTWIIQEPENLGSSRTEIDYTSDGDEIYLEYDSSDTTLQESWTHDDGTYLTFIFTKN